MRLKGLVFAALASFALVAGPAAGQGTTSRVSGIVTDSSGGRIPGATVTLTNDGTGISFIAVTGETGSYSLEAVQVGRYTLTVELQGNDQPRL